MRRYNLDLLTFALLIGCGADKPNGDTGTSSTTTPNSSTTSTETTQTNITETTTESTTETTTTADPFSKLRIVHLAADLGPTDLFINESSTQTMNALTHQDGTPFTDRPVGSFHFDYSLTGNDASNSLVEFDADLIDQVWHSHAIVGEQGAYQVWQYEDDFRNIGPGVVRIRWTHAALGLGEVDLLESYRDATIATDLAYGDSVVVNPTSGAMSVGIDLNNDGVADWTFRDFDFGDDTNVNIYLNDDGNPLVDGNTPFLIAHKRDGDTPRNDVVPQ